MAALTVAAFVTLLVDVAGGSREPVVLVPGAIFLVLATLGYEWVTRQARRRLSYAYIIGLFLCGFAVFVVSEASVGSTLMLVVLVIQATLTVPLAAVVVLVVLLPLFHAGMDLSEGVREGLGLFAAAVFAAVLTKLLMREQQARQALARAQREVERLAASEERNRIARDIHDGLGHSLTVVQMQIKAARAVLSQPAKADEMLGKAQDQAEEALREVRRSVGALRSPVPLPEALKRLTDETTIVGRARPLAAEAEESLFRAAQEGLTNVHKHAHATRAELFLDFSDPDCVRLEVRDNGTGVAGGDTGGFGLLGLRERAARLGGRLTLESAPGAGATLRMEVPG
ncbi:Signal transduction histidine kinase [Paractinoplanes atraurantiacus]|uniref:Oxygen sensor histidine kinase NreB n=2 Tax=Paractinoplanes atraurantiacus TaxID=1036182 RepID=A0A285IIE2_9ACTN|nr:Signal transduction histidine kinase [Actinoplanes atraurantiacus]